MDFNEQITAEFRDNGGQVASYGFEGSTLVLLHSVGARTGAERISPLMSLPDGDGWLVVASAGGSPRNPAWFHNILATPDTVVEIGVDGRVETVPVRAEVLDGAERDAAYARFEEHSAGFTGYKERAGRVIPVVRLTRR